MTTRPQPVAITIGNFDGVHLGHVALVHAAKRAMNEAGRVVALVFEPHPQTVIQPDRTIPKLTTFEQKRVWLTNAGASDVIPLTPTLEFLSQSPEQFIVSVVNAYRPSLIVEGADFRFGKSRAGSIDTLRQFEGKHGYRTIVVDGVEMSLTDQSITRVSSTLIRHLLGLGRVRDAAILLGRPYELIAKVVKGDQRGRTIGVPTANLGNVQTLLPADGIYAGLGEIETDGGPRQSFAAAISIGTKPTFGDHPRTCEAHLIGYDGPLDDYGWTIHLRFTDWLRDQLVYTDVNLLIDQLHRDIERTKKAFGMGHEAQAARHKPKIANA